MNVAEAFEQEGTDEIFIEEECHDCKDPVKVKVTPVEDGYQFEAQDEAATYGPKIEDVITPFYKCKKCYDENPTLKDFRPTEVYTRVVGYYRPIKAFNVGKSAEYKDRRNYKM